MEELYSLLKDQKDRINIDLDIEWCRRQLGLEKQKASKLICLILSAGVKPIDVNPILWLLSKYKIEQSSQENFIKTILIALNGDASCL